MAVYDRWHLRYPDPDRDKPCKCGRAGNTLYPTAVHQRGKRWQVRWYDDTGKQLKQNFAKKEGKDPTVHAEAFDADNQAKLNADDYTDPSAGAILVEAYAKQWRATLTGKPSSLDIIDKRLAHIYDVERGPRSRRPEGSSTIAGLTMAQLAKRPTAIREWVKGLTRKGLAPQYVSDIVATLSSICLAAMADGVIKSNPARSKTVRLPTIPKRRVVPWSSDQLAAGREKLREQDQAMIETGLGFGLRAGEIFALAEDDLVFLAAEPFARVRRQVRLLDGEPYFDLPKYDKEREVPMSKALAVRLAAHLEAFPPVAVTLPWGSPEGNPRTFKLLFPRRKAEAWTANSFAYWWRTCKAAAGVADVKGNGMHVLRHTAASVWLAAGVDIKKVAVWLGHEDAGFTWRTYVHFIPDRSGVGRAAMDAFLDGAEGDEGEEKPGKIL